MTNRPSALDGAAGAAVGRVRGAPHSPSLGRPGITAAHGDRFLWERMEPPVLERCRAELFEAIGQMKETGIPIEFQILLTRAGKPQSEENVIPFGESAAALLADDANEESCCQERFPKDGTEE